MPLELASAPDNELAHLYGKPLIPYHLRHCITPTGLELPDNLDFDSWQSLGDGLQIAQGKIDWYLSDWLVWGRLRYANRYMDAVNLTGIALQTLYNKASVAYRVPKERRVPSLTFAHHEVVASCAPDEQTRLLSMAEASGMTVRELREMKTGVADTVKRLTGESAELGAEVCGFISPAWITDLGWKLTREQRQEVVRAWNEVDEMAVL